MTSRLSRSDDWGLGQTCIPEEIKLEKQAQRARKRGVTFRTERGAVKMFSRGFPLFSSCPSAGVVLSNTEVRSEIYGRFMGGSGRNRSNSGRLGQCVQHMQTVQSRINTGDFVS